MKLNIFHPTKKVRGHITLGGSKSISNRVQIIRALCSHKFNITGLSDSDDTKVLHDILANVEATNDVHHAGTSFRFLTSYLCLHDGEQVLTGSDRMQQRPVGPLVDALRSLGAHIDYLKEEGFPPLRIGAPPSLWAKKVKIRGDISSQFISSLLLIAPVLPQGLHIYIEGDLVSRPYLEMTVAIMKHFGANIQMSDFEIIVSHGGYTSKDFVVEADWSSASYYFSCAALSDSCDISISGLSPISLQADAEMLQISEGFGVESKWNGDILHLSKCGEAKPFYEGNFISCPDIAQTVFAMMAGTQTKGLFTGLKTLIIKETDRISASNQELQKFGYFLSKVPQRFKTRADEDMYMLDGAWSADKTEIDTYNDHRMAMAFAPLSLLVPLVINDAMVVTKSYPNFWEDMEQLGFIVSEIKN